MNRYAIRLACTVKAELLHAAQGPLGSPVETTQFQYTLQTPMNEPPQGSALPQPIVIVCPDPGLLEVGKRYILTISELALVEPSEN